MKEECIGVEVGARVTTSTVGEEPLAWAISKASKSRVFSSNPMPSGMFVASWLALTCVGFKHLHKVLGVSSRSSC